MDHEEENDEPKTKPISKLILELSDTRKLSLSTKLYRIVMLVILLSVLFLLWFFFIQSP